MAITNIVVLSGDDITTRSNRVDAQPGAEYLTFDDGGGRYYGARMSPGEAPFRISSIVIPAGEAAALSALRGQSEEWIGNRTTEITLEDDTDEIDLDGLNGYYKIIIVGTNGSEAEADYEIWPNKVEGSSKVISSRIYYGSSASPTQAVATSSGWCGKALGDDKFRFEVKFSTEGEEVGVKTLVATSVAFNTGAPSLTETSKCSIYWTDPGEMTSVRFTSDVPDGFKVGTKIKIIEVGT